MLNQNYSCMSLYCMQLFDGNRLALIACWQRCMLVIASTIQQQLNILHVSGVINPTFICMCHICDVTNINRYLFVLCDHFRAICFSKNFLRLILKITDTSKRISGERSFRSRNQNGITSPETFLIKTFNVFVHYLMFTV